MAYLPEVDVWHEPPTWLTAYDLGRLASLPPISVDAGDALDALFANFRGMNAAIAP